MPLTHTLKFIAMPLLAILTTTGCKEAAKVIGIKSVTPNPPSGSYDIEAVFVKYSPNPVKVGDKVTFTTEHKNTGRDQINARTYEVELTLDGKLISFDRDTSDLPPDSRVQYSRTPGSFHWQPNKPGTYYYKLTVDVKNTIHETNESNNCITGSIVVTP